MLLVVSLIGFALFLFTGLVWVGQVPGIHFDEAWAAEFAYRIATEPSFRPLDAMSPYTHPWAHYITAFFFRYFGVNLFVYRAAGVVMCAVGAVLAWIALVRAGEKKGAMIFPFLLALSVPFVTGERFSIEITSFLILCLGLLILGAQLKSAVMVFLAVFFGVTSHILFLAPTLGLAGVWALQSGKWRSSLRALVALCALSLWPFLWKIHQEIPEKDKADFLLVADVLILFSVLFLDQMPRPIRRMRENIRWLAAVLALPFFGYLVFFLEGHWSLLFFSGRLAELWMLAFSVPLTFVGLIYLGRIYRRETWSAPEQRFWSWALFTLLFLGILAVKPAPRYFQIAFFLMAFGGALLLGRLPGRKAFAFLIPYAALGLLMLRANYFLPGLREQQIAHSYRFLIFHDSSEDTLPKQSLARSLGERGCDYSKVDTSDPRLGAALRFLSHGDWVVSSQATCPGARVQVAVEPEGTFKLSWE